MENPPTRPIDARLAFEIHKTRPSLHTRNPFDSPGLSTSSVNETEDGSTSEQSEFHLQRYSSNAKYKHFRQVSKASTTASDRDKKPGLSIVTDFSSPKIPLVSTSVAVNEVPAKRIQPGQNRIVSIVSQKGVHAMTTPREKRFVGLQDLNISASKETSTKKSSKKTRYVQQLRNVVKQQARGASSVNPDPVTMRPKRDAGPVQQDGIDTNTTPQTPAILVTPAGEQVPWVLQVRGGEYPHRPASSIYSAMPTSRIPTVPHFDAPPVPSINNARSNQQLSPDESAQGLSPGNTELTLSGVSDSDRPQSQGWWNLMLSPLMRNGSQASKISRNAHQTSPVPPMPVSAITKESSPATATSIECSPSIIISAVGASPETPRRAGLATAHASTWSRWTEWEEEREANNHREVLEEDDDAGDGFQLREEDDVAKLIPTTTAVSTKPGLAAEYYHACAVEQLTGEPYFECISHSCAEKLPQLCSIYDTPANKEIALGSPFEEKRDHDNQLTSARDLLSSPSVLEDLHSPLSPNDLSPNVRQASIAAVVKARSFESLASKKKTGMTKSSEVSTESIREEESPSHSTVDEKADLRKILIPTSNNGRLDSKLDTDSDTATASGKPQGEKTIPVPIDEVICEKSKGMVSSPSPMSPDGQKALHPPNGMQMMDFEGQQTSRVPPIVINNYTNPHSLPERPGFITADTSYPELPQRAPTAAVTVDDLEPTSRINLDTEKRRRRLEKEDATAKKVGGLWRGRGCFSSSNCMGRGGPESRAKRRWIIVISTLLLILIIVCISLAVTLTRHEDTTPINGQWLNLTGFPPMPTGVLTIATPNLAYQQSQCMVVSTFWSCSVPKEDYDELNGNDPTQPNFRFEIKFRNGTVPANLTIPISNTKTSPKTSNDPFTNDLYIPNPTPPNTADQIFLGNTTDNITAPFNGEQTPFYLTLMPTFPIVPPAFNSSASLNDLSSRHARRQDSNSSFTSGNPSAIPAPAVLSNGTAAPANLLPTDPFPANQPVRLYNRGLPDEHYGFYIYYDKSIFISALVLNGTTYTGPPVQAVAADQNGGSTLALANARCTFSQTRFLVKFFTNPSFSGNLLATPLPLGGGIDTSNSKNKKNATLSSAINFNRPGSFPYPASIVLDRHGGNIDSKGVYCYGVDDGQIVKDNRIVLGEDINLGGVAINHPNFPGFNQTAGGIDGGTGGCGCQWQNWQ